MAVRKILLPALGGVIAGTLLGIAGWRAIESRRMGRVWRSLELEEKSGEFSESLVGDLPEPVRRYFRHSISPGVPLYSRVSLKVSGKIKANRKSPWMRFTARQILTPHRGFVWKARAWKGPLFLEVADHYARGAGCMRVALLGLVPVVNATGPDLSKSALGRLMAESVLMPSALLPQQGAAWEAEDNYHIKATLTVDEEAATLNMTIDD